MDFNIAFFMDAAILALLAASGRPAICSAGR